MLRHRQSLLITLAVAASLSACSAAEPGNSTPSAPAVSASSAGYPVRVHNCGRELVVQKPPQRIASLDQNTTETLLSLGVGDRVVGTSTWFDPILPELEAANADIPRIADNNPSLEAFLATEPDFVAATFRADLPGEGSSTIESLGQLGLPVYMAPAECAKATDGTGDGRRETPLTMDAAYQEIDELSRIVGVPEAGAKLNERIRADLAAASTGDPGAGKTVAFWFANSESPYVAGGYGTPAVSARALGLTNVFAESRDEWPQVSWEAFAQKDPDVLVLGDLTRKRQTSETGAVKIAFLESNPVTKEMTAVKNKRYILLQGSDMHLGVRTPAATAEIAQGLAKVGAR
ncbi:ABC transporter substrate-binding protein [Mobilicoccus caccae]|uniref:ABC transporter substrate-binding protein n=1 Tax=Mobilicoccus caccae TaxID=1859295 RepID=A0ABQ6IJG9_9MICO|nr:ABC transporter substrate-binding protein [Mobilicoccus caccae]GMA38063.1 ABC transporter substrate-binding protein [Mobilicoccus caccae]